MNETIQTMLDVESQPRATHSAWGQRIDLAVDDLIGAIHGWRIWVMLGLNDVRQRYQRSRLGQFWITASMAVFIAALTVVYSTLFKMDLREYAPFLVGNLVIWNFIAAAITDSCITFTQSEGFLKQERLSKLIFPLRLMVRNIVILAHNAVLIPIVFFLAGKGFNWATFAVVPGFVLLCVNGLLFSLIIGMICTRFRDFPQIVSNLVQIGFFVTPVVWRPDQIQGPVAWVVDWNPFAQHLILLSEPLHGVMPPLRAYLFCLALFLVLFMIASLAFARFRARIVYWL